MDLPHSDAGHNPYWCGGDYNGQANGDDPCWSCINFFLASHALLVEALEPFAKLCEALDGKQKGLAQKDEDTVYAFNHIEITLGDLRRALQAAKQGR